MIYLLLILFNPFIAALRSQTPAYKADLEALNRHYMELDQIRYEMNYYLYTVGDHRLIEQHRSSFKKKGAFYLTSDAEQELLVNANYIILVDHEDKDVIVRKNRETGGKKNVLPDVLPQHLGLYVDTLLTFYAKVEPLPGSNALTSMYRFYPKAGPYTQVDMAIDRQGWLIKEIVLYPEEPEEMDGREVPVYLKIQFVNYTTQAVVGNEFSEDRYLSKVNGVLKLKPNFLKYELHDETH